MPHDVRQPHHYDLKQTEANLRALFHANGNLPDDAPGEAKAQERGREISLQQALWTLNEANVETGAQTVITAMAGLTVSWLRNFEQPFDEDTKARIRTVFQVTLAGMLSDEAETIECGSADVSGVTGGNA